MKKTKTNYNDRMWKLFHQTESRLLDCLLYGISFFGIIYLLSYIINK